VCELLGKFSLWEITEREGEERRGGREKR